MFNFITSQTYGEQRFVNNEQRRRTIVLRCSSVFVYFVPELVRFDYKFRWIYSNDALFYTLSLIQVLTRKVQLFCSSLCPVPQGKGENLSNSGMSAVHACRLNTLKSGNVKSVVIMLRFIQTICNPGQEYQICRFWHRQHILILPGTMKHRNKPYTPAEYLSPAVFS